MRAITERQQQMLDIIRDHIARRGFPPTVREIGRVMGIRSTNGVIDHLDSLERKGAIERDRTQARAIRLVEGAPPTPRRPSFTASPRLLELMQMRANIADQLRLVDKAIELEKRITSAGR